MKKIIFLLITLMLSSIAYAENLYVEQTSGTCNDAYTRTQATNTATPWCSIEQLDGKSLAGDMTHVIGLYRDETTITINNQAYTSMTFLNVSKADIKGSFTAPSWNSEGSNRYNTSSISTTSDTVHCYYNNILLFPYDTLAHMIDNSGNPRGSYWDNANDRLHIRLWAGDAAPSSTNIFCAQQATIEVANMDNFTIVGDGTGNVSWGTNVILVYSSTPTNNDILGVNIKGGGDDGGAIHVVGINYGNIKFNNITRTHNQNESWCLKKDCSEEAFGVELGCIWSENNKNINIENNTCSGYFNGINHQTSSAGSDNNTNIRWNKLNDIYDDALEFEKHASNINVSYNEINDVFVGVSLAPLNCTTANGTCWFGYNKINANKTIQANRDTGTTYAPYGFKFDTLTVSTTGLTIVHNTCIGGAKCWYETDESRLTRQNWVVDNIFSASGNILDVTGYANNGMHFDYNVYDRTTTGTLFQDWNNQSGTQASLASALASIYWNGAWDLHSLETGTDVGINLGINRSVSIYGFAPNITSPLCDGTINASDGGTVGAVSCTGMSSQGDEIVTLDPTPSTSSVISQLRLNITARINTSNLNNLSLTRNGQTRYLKSDSLLLYLNFDNNTVILENQSLLVDESKFNMTSNITATVITNCPWGKCRQSTHDTGYVTMNTNVDVNLLQNWSFETYVNLSDEPCFPFQVCGAVFNQFISNIRNGTVLAVMNDSGVPKWRVHVANSTTYSSNIGVETKQGQFSHVILTRAGQVYTLYVDGQLAQRYNYTTIPESSGRPLVLMSYGTGTANYSLSASYEYMRLYNYTMTEEDVKTNFVLVKEAERTYNLNTTTLLTSEGETAFTLGINDATTTSLNYTVEVSYNLTLNLSNIAKQNDLIMGIQEKDENREWLTSQAIQQLHPVVATHERIWKHEINYNPRMTRTEVLNDDCTTYNWENLTRAIYVTLHMGLVPHIELLAQPNCMSNGTGVTNNDHHLPRNFTEYANYKATIIKHYYDDYADDGMLNYTNSSGQYLIAYPSNFSQIYWSIRNEPNQDLWWGTDANLSKLINITIKTIKSQVPEASICQAGGENARVLIIEERISAFYGNLSPENYPDCFGMHNYDDAKAAMDTMTCSGCNITTYDTFLDGTKDQYYDAPNEAIAQVRAYKNNTVFLNFEYNMDSIYSPSTAPAIYQQRGKAWACSALLWQTVSEIDGQNFFEGTSYIGQYFGMWNNTGAYGTPLHSVYGNWSQKIRIGDNITYAISADGVIETLATPNTIVVCNKRNITTDLYLSIPGTKGAIQDSQGNLIEATSDTYQVTIDGYDAQFYDILGAIPLGRSLRGNLFTIRGQLARI